MRGSRRLATCLLAVLVAGGEARSESDPDGPLVDEGEDAVEALIGEADAVDAGGRVLLPARLAERVGVWRGWIDERLGLAGTFGMDSLVYGQRQDGRWLGTWAVEAGVAARWEVVRGGWLPLTLAGKFRHRSVPVGDSPGDLIAGTDAYWKFVDGFTDAGWEVPSLYAQTVLFDERLLVRVGQLKADDLIDGHPLRSSKRYFLNQAFASSPGVGLPSTGFGVAGRWASLRDWDVTAHFSNVAGGNLSERAGFRLDTDALFTAVEFGRDFRVAGGAGRLQLLLWQGDALPDEGVDAGRGVALTLAHDQESWLGFLRLAWADGEATTVDRMVSGAVAVRPDPEGGLMIGLGVGAGRGTVPGDDIQSVVEVFSGLRLGEVRVSGGIQINHGNNLPGDGWALGGGIVFGVVF